MMEISAWLMDRDVGNVVKADADYEFKNIDVETPACELGQLSIRNPNQLGSSIVDDRYEQRAI